MKNQFLKGLLSISSLFLMLNANAQVGIGVKGGLNLSKLTNIVEQTNSTSAADAGLGFMPTIENNFLLGGNFGAVVSYKANKSFAVQAEFLYSSQGTKISASLAGLKYESKLVTNYFQLPVLAKLSFGSDKVKGFVNAGPYFGYMLSAAQSVPSSTNSSGDETEEIDLEDPQIKESLNRVDIGLAIGAGVAITAGPGDIIIEARYNYGFLDLTKLEPKPAGYKSIHNSVINISAGYIFYFGGK